MFETYPTGNDEVGGCCEVDRDDGVVSLLVFAIGLIVDDATVFAHFEFVAVPMGRHAVAFAFGDVLGIDPESVIDGFVVVEGSG